VTTYTKRDLRAADMLAMTLLGLGAMLIVFGVVKLTGSAASLNAKQQIDESRIPVSLWVAVASFMLLGMALNLKVRELVRSKGREPEDYAGVAE
jgi:hypothetical protein